jgi:hypothetical protein
MTLLEKIKINLDYLLGKAEPYLYAEGYKSQNLTLKDWQKRWEKFSYDGCGFIWYGVDADENLAEFSSEEAYVPEAFFQNASVNKKLSNFFDNLPETSGSIIPENLRPELKDSAQKFNGENSFWKTGASRGLFIFDEADGAGMKGNKWKSPYELLLIPGNPLKLAELPNEIQNLLKPFSFEDSRFADCQFLDVSKYLYCEE